MKNNRVFENKFDRHIHAFFKETKDNLESPFYQTLLERDSDYAIKNPKEADSKEKELCRKHRKKGSNIDTLKSSRNELYILPVSAKKAPSILKDIRNSLLGKYLLYSGVSLRKNEIHLIFYITDKRKITTDIKEVRNSTGYDVLKGKINCAREITPFRDYTIINKNALPLKKITEDFMLAFCAFFPKVKKSKI